jgi:hypothetical protein
MGWITCNFAPHICFFIYNSITLVFLNLNTFFRGGNERPEIL